MVYMSLKLHFLHSHMDECGEGSIRTIHKWKRGTVENRVQMCWVNTAGVL